MNPAHLRPRLAQSLEHTRRVQDPIEALSGLVVVPIRHGDQPLQPLANHAELGSVG